MKLVKQICGVFTALNLLVGQSNGGDARTEFFWLTGETWYVWHETECCPYSENKSISIQPIHIMPKT